MPRARAPWVRGLRLYRTSATAPPEPPDDEHVHARSHFRGVHHPDRRAEYTLRAPGDAPARALAPGDHTLAVVREFRRVPLHASGLGLAIFAARLGREAQVVAALAHFAERALSFYQPSYLLLGRSLEQPGIAALLAGVQSHLWLDAPAATTFSVDDVLGEVRPLLAADPEWYAYTPGPAVEHFAAVVSRDAV